MNIFKKEECYQAITNYNHNKLSDFLPTSDGCNKLSKSVSYETLVVGTTTSGTVTQQSRRLNKGSAESSLNATGTLPALLRNPAKVVESFLNKVRNFNEKYASQAFDNLLQESLAKGDSDVSRFGFLLNESLTLALALFLILVATSKARAEIDHCEQYGTYRSCYDKDNHLLTYRYCQDSDDIREVCLSDIMTGSDMFYDEKGNNVLTKNCESYDSNDNCTKYYGMEKYTYDENGNMIMVISCNSGGADADVAESIIDSSTGECKKYTHLYKDDYNYDSSDGVNFISCADPWEWDEDQCSQFRVAVLDENEDISYKLCTDKQMINCFCESRYYMKNSVCVDDCGDGYKAESGVCVAKTCAEMYEGSSETQCESSVSGCSVTTCSEVGTLADGSKCYKTEQQNIAPQCGAHAQLIEDADTCACQCDEGYSGDGTNCALKTCAEISDGSSETCTPSTSGCVVTSCRAVASRADGASCYVSETSDYTPENCGDGRSVVGEGSGCACVCDGGKVERGGKCIDPLETFAKKRYTPAEADQWLYDENNTVTLTFKK